MQFFQLLAGEPSYASASVAIDAKAYIRSSDAQFAPTAKNATSAAVACMQARMHPLAPISATGYVVSGASAKSAVEPRGLELYLASSVLWGGLPEASTSVSALVLAAQQQLEDGEGIKVSISHRLLLCACMCAPVGSAMGWNEAASHEAS
jgi:hypothetical protein